MSLHAWFAATILLSAPAAAEPEPLSLAGTWLFALDRNDRGIADGWFNRELQQRISLPGALQAQGFGDVPSVDTAWTGDIVDRSWFTDPRMAKYRRPGNIKVPFWLQPEKHYVGAAWYGREIEIPAAWQGKRVTLYLERPHWETRVWLDGRELGRRDSLATPHVYELGTSLAAGKHRISIRVDNRMIVEVGVNAHSVTDHTQSNWNGVVGRIELRATDPVWIEQVDVYPNPAGKKPKLVVRVGNATGRGGRCLLTYAYLGGGGVCSFDLEPTGWTYRGDLPFGDDRRTRDEFRP